MEWSYLLNEDRIDAKNKFAYTTVKLLGISFRLHVVYGKQLKEGKNIYKKTLIIVTIMYSLVLSLAIPKVQADEGSMMGFGSMMGNNNGLLGLGGLTWIAMIIFLLAGAYFFIKKAGK
ncbi:MAG: hypothetical protein ABIJ03_03455 [Patescibacteria group bacterium]